MKRNEIVVLSLGGSMINGKEGFSIEFLKDFKKLILKNIKKGRKFIIVCGGGRVAREYQEAAKASGLSSNRDLDWIGIFGTHCNANFMKTLFGKLSHSELVKSENDKISWKSKILFSGGWEPGCSTDYDAVILAKKFGAKTVINLSNIDFVFDKDPNKFTDAKKIENISWKDFRKIVGNKWSPGANAPFDPIASKIADNNKLKVIVMNGKRLGELEKAINGSTDLIGTIIG